MERSDSQNNNVGKKYMGKKASAAAPVAAAKKAMSAVKPCTLPLGIFRQSAFSQAISHIGRGGIVSSRNTIIGDYSIRTETEPALE